MIKGNFSKYALIVLVFTSSIYYSCEEILFIPDISKESVTLIGPSDSVKVLVGNINFNWEHLEDAEAYKIQIATPNFTAVQQVVLDSLLPITLDTLQPITKITKGLDVGIYQWRVKAINAGYETNYTMHNLTVIE
ncbi:hypothetical protein [Lutibacter sp. HS1-25]|uniref:hypothetical protein n=1 Tax=Lutibacter sp. HS1-25 TaxID=2485000 RepID=UPI001010D861|nr:hypothetical protein [Lutibacter sp. HS1-25]